MTVNYIMGRNKTRLSTEKRENDNSTDRESYCCTSFLASLVSHDLTLRCLNGKPCGCQYFLSLGKPSNGVLRNCSLVLSLL